MAPAPLAITPVPRSAYLADMVDGEEEEAESAEEVESVEEADVEDEALGAEDEPAESAEGEDAEVDEDREEEVPGELTIPSYRGTGMLVTAGVLGALAMSVMGLRVARIQEYCTAEGLEGMTVSEDNLDTFVNNSAECFVAGRGVNAALWAFQAAPNAATWGLAPAGAMRRAKYDAAVSVKTGAVDRSPGAWIGAGAALLGAGALGRTIVAVIRIRSLSPFRGVAANCVNGEVPTGEFFDCYADRNSLLYGMHQLTSSAVGAGAGMLTYGLVYQRERRTLSSIYGPGEATTFEFSVQPQLGLSYTGASAAFRF